MRNSKIKTGMYYIIPHIKNDKTSKQTAVVVTEAAINENNEDIVLYDVLQSSNLLSSNDKGIASLDWFEKNARLFKIRHPVVRDIYSNLEKMLLEK